MRCRFCNNDKFVAHQVLYADVLVDEQGRFSSNMPEGLESAVYDCDSPYGPYTCTCCGAEYDELSVSSVTAGPNAMPPAREDWLCQLAYDRLSDRLRGVGGCYSYDDFKVLVWPNEVCMRLAFPEDFLYMQYLNLHNPRFCGAFADQETPSHHEVWGDEAGDLCDPDTKAPILPENLPTKPLRDDYVKWQELLARGIACALVSDEDFGAGVMVRQAIPKGGSIPFIEIADRVSDMAAFIKKNVQFKVLLREGKYHHMLSLIFHGGKSTKADTIDSVRKHFAPEYYSKP